MDLLHLLSKFFPTNFFFLGILKRKIFLSKNNFGGKKIYLRKKVENGARSKGWFPIFWARYMDDGFGNSGRNRNDGIEMFCISSSANDVY
jgi:hypothetical protein